VRVVLKQPGLQDIKPIENNNKPILWEQAVVLNRGNTVVGYL